jgi:hypothetical protein
VAACVAIDKVAMKGSGWVGERAGGIRAGGGKSGFCLGTGTPVRSE